MSEEAQRLQSEIKFHDEWADSVNVREIDVRHVSEAVTSPELRAITARFAPWQGRRVLDVGCGLGEAGTYFALQGADVTCLDLSPGMLRVATRLAEQNGVKVKTHLAAAEKLGLAADEKFDVIYLGNLFHHVEIEETLIKLKQHLAPGGSLISWDPMAYNPIINVYRMMATKNRTPDEHPLRLRDLRLFAKHFEVVEKQYFWLTSLVIFILMFAVNRRNPNKEKFWKLVIYESEKWKPLYVPLAKLDRLLLRVFPFLGPLCWNVVIEARGPRP